jgi:hypothetical protein
MDSPYIEFVPLDEPDVIILLQKWGFLDVHDFPKFNVSYCGARAHRITVSDTIR